METSKEKAKELVDKYRKYVDDGRHNGFYSGEITFNNQKQCALIAVDEIIRAIPDASDNDSPYNDELLWWKEVRHEIEQFKNK